MSLKKVMVIGAGQMGSGIAYVSAVNAKKSTILVDDEIVLNKAKKYLNMLFDKQKGKLTEEMRIIRSRIHFVPRLEEMSLQERNDVYFCIEAIPEQFEMKKTLFEQLDKLLPKDAILASNTSSISISRIAACTNRPSQVIGQHFMNPVPVLKLCELIKGLETSQSTYETTVDLTKQMGKVITTSSDVPGLIANRLLCPYINEAIIALENGIGSKEDIDTTMVLGMAHRMGPLKLADLIGLDTVLNIMTILHTELGDKYRPATLLKSMVYAKKLGKKTGNGFYTYE